MGYNYANELASGEFVTTLEQQIAIHFSSNCYPPIPKIMIDVAIESINACNEGDYYKEVSLPSGVSFRGNEVVSAGQVVESLRLEAWIDEE